MMREIPERYLALQEIAVAQYSHKKHMPSKRIHTSVIAVPHRKGLRIIIPKSFLSELDLEKGDKLSVVKLPNGNYVVARTQRGATLGKISAGAVSLHALITQLKIKDNMDKVEARIEDGLAIFSPTAFTPTNGKEKT